jgi:uncharacterized protein DUF1549/uncharacterized protein DUF1553
MNIAGPRKPGRLKMRLFSLSPIIAVWALLLSGAVEAANLGTLTRIEVQPAKIALQSARREMRLVVSGWTADGQVEDLSQAATVRSSDEQVVKVEHGVAKPVGNGKAELVVEIGGHRLQVPVEVSGQQTPEPVSFRYETLAALTRQGCNSGACHGSPSGKGGFRLSLRAYDPVLDAGTLVRESYNRRTNLAEPENSLLLRKPTLAVPHGGGRRLQPTDTTYALLRDWIAEGCVVDPPDAPHCVRVEVYPRERVLHRPAHTQQLLALAHFSDGSVRDVTLLASFSSSDDAVATVDGQGNVVGLERGEAAILVRYLEFMDTSSLMFLRDVEGFRWRNPPQENFVDRHVFEKLRQLQIAPAELATDEEFVRRVYLDVIGQLPTIAQSRAFVQDRDPQKRSKLIDALLARPEYAEFWALKWGDLLRLRNAKMTPAGVHKFHRWLVRALEDDMPYDQFARELLTATGSTYTNPPANYFRTAVDTNDCTESTSQLFLGIRIQCAKCHNHPFERWTQDNYYGIGAFFQRVERKKVVGQEEMVVWVARSGEVVQPRTGRQMKPWLPLAGDADLPGENDRREAFCAWLTRDDNPFFARVEVNRLWGQLLGRGIVEPVDDFRDSNPPANKALLDALARDFVEHGYNVRHTLRTILNSRTYQLSSRKNAFNQDDTRYFSHARARLLTAEQLLDAICAVTDVSEKYAGLPAGLHATQLPSPDVENSFLKVFGQPARETACQCERGGESNLSQALQMINGPLVHGKLRDAHNRLRQLIAAGKANREIIGELYLAAFSRPPSEPELTAAVKHVAASGDQVRGLEDVCWALLNANEFLFQH